MSHPVARRDILMSRGKNCRQTVLFLKLTRNCPHRRVILKEEKRPSSRGGETVWEAFWETICWEEGKRPHPQDKIQHLDFTKDPRPLYYKTPPWGAPPCAFYHKIARSKAVFGP